MKMMTKKQAKNAIKKLRKKHKINSLCLRLIHYAENWCGIEVVLAKNPDPFAFSKDVTGYPLISNSSPKKIDKFLKAYKKCYGYEFSH